MDYKKLIAEIIKNANDQEKLEIIYYFTRRLVEGY